MMKMADKGPKTSRGIENRIATGEGRISYIKQVKEAVLGNKKKQGRKKK